MKKLLILLLFIPFGIQAQVTQVIADELVGKEDLKFNTPYGLLYDNSGLVVSITPNDVYYTATGFTVGISNEITCTDSTFTIVKSGTYLCLSSQSFIGSNNSMVCHLSVFVDDVEAVIEAERKLGTASDVGATSNSGILTLTAGQVVKLKAKSNTGSTVTYNHITFTLFKIN